MLQNRFKEIQFLIIILVGAAAIRFFNLSSMSLMNDELSALFRAYERSFSDLIEYGVKPDFHPAGAQVFIYYWIKIFGDSVFSLRFPFAVCGILSVLACYKLGSLWFNKTAGLFAAASLAFLQFPILYSQLARMYSMALLATLLFTYCWSCLFLITSDNRKLKIFWQLSYVLTGAACLYLHYFALMFAGIVGLTGLFLINRTDFKSYIVLNFLIILFFLPHINVFLFQFNKGGIGGPDGWLPTPDTSTFFEYIKSFFNDFNLYFLIFLIPLLCFILNKKVIVLSKFHWLTLWLYIAPFFIAYWYSILRNPVLQITGMLFSFPFLLMFIFSFIPNQFNFKTSIVLTSFIVLLLYSTIIQNKYFTTYHFGEYKELADLAVNFNKKYGSNNITQVMNVQNRTYIDYYFKKFKYPVNFSMYQTAFDADCAELMRLASASKKPYFIYAFTNMRNPPQVQRIIEEYYPNLIFRKDMFNAGFYVFSKDSIENKELSRGLYVFEHHYDQIIFQSDSLFINSDSNDYGFHFADISVAEFGPAFEKKLSEMNYKNGCTLNASIKVFSTDAITDSYLVLTILKNDSAYVWVNADLKNWVKEKNVWTSVFTSSEIPKEFDGSEIVKVFIWHRDKSRLLIDDLKITLTETVDYYRKGIEK